MSLPPSSMHIRSLYLPAPAASAALFCCKAWCSANLNPTLCVILIYRDAQCSTQDVSCLSSDLDRKEVMHVWKHRSTRLLYILQCDVLRRLVTGHQHNARQLTATHHLQGDTSSHLHRAKYVVVSNKTHVKLSFICICSKFCMNSPWRWGGRFGTPSMVVSLIGSVLGSMVGLGDFVRKCP
eukprot:scaffold2347_cov208-Alexandrium_tamarense.AAC.12